MTVTQEDIKQAVIEAGSDDSNHFSFPEKEDGLHLQQDPEEYSAFVHYAMTSLQPPELALDIGIASGGQTKFLRDYFPIKKTLIIDIGDHHKHHHWQRIKPMVKTDIVMEKITDSHSAEAREALLPYKGQIDFAFIDGDHTYVGLTQDVDLFREVAKPGAIFVLHDTTCVKDCAKVMEDLLKDPAVERLKNFDNKFGISVWRLKEIGRPKRSWIARKLKGLP